MSESNLNWSYCPVCGNKLPKLNTLKFCINCGLDLQYIKKNLRFPPHQNIKSSPQQYQMGLFPPFESERKKISDEDLIKNTNYKLWSGSASIGIPFLAFLLLNIITTFIILFFLSFSLNLEELSNLIFNPYIIIISSLAEFIFIFVPVLFVGRYLQNPSLKNRMMILGFTSKGYNKTEILREILIGIAFALIGILLVSFVSTSVEIALELIFGVEIIQDIGSTTGEFDAIIFSSDIYSLILLLIIMILVIGTSEEILFRGFMQKGLVRSLGKNWGIFITALIFAMIHLIGIFLLIPFDSAFFLISFLLSFFPYFGLSLMLGVLFYWRRENLIAVMITHGFYNALTIAIAYFFFSLV
ncbi:MAG: type II CAAX prenyl endopeptidase Rce1 family protein [Candidatus Hodarchaeota archaeon]